MLCGCFHIARVHQVHKGVPEEESADSGHNGQSRYAIELEDGVGSHARSMACYSLRQRRHLSLHSLPQREQQLRSLLERGPAGDQSLLQTRGALCACTSSALAQQQVASLPRCWNATQRTAAALARRWTLSGRTMYKQPFSSATTRCRPACML